MRHLPYTVALLDEECQDIAKFRFANLQQCRRSVDLTERAFNEGRCDAVACSIERIHRGTRTFVDGTIFLKAAV